MKITLNNNVKKYFKEDENGNYIGYHIESTDKAYASFLPSLTIDTLNNDQVLNLWNNIEDYWSGYLGKIALKHFKILEITFKKTDYKVYSNFDEFLDVKETTDGDVYYNGEKLLKETGTYLHVMDKNDTVKIIEAFLIHPKDFVVSIKEIIF